MEKMEEKGIDKQLTIRIEELYEDTKSTIVVNSKNSRKIKDKEWS